MLFYPTTAFWGEPSRPQNRTEGVFQKTRRSSSHMPLNNGCPPHQRQRKQQKSPTRGATLSLSGLSGEFGRGRRPTFFSDDLGFGKKERRNPETCFKRRLLPQPEFLTASKRGRTEKMGSLLPPCPSPGMGAYLISPSITTDKRPDEEIPACLSKYGGRQAFSTNDRLTEGFLERLLQENLRTVNEQQSVQQQRGGGV